MNINRFLKDINDDYESYYGEERIAKLTKLITKEINAISMIVEELKFPEDDREKYVLHMYSWMNNKHFIGNVQVLYDKLFEHIKELDELLAKR